MTCEASICAVLAFTRPISTVNASTARFPQSSPQEKEAVRKPARVQFRYRHQNRRYYVRAFATGKKKWASHRTNLLAIARNSMAPGPDAAQRQRPTGMAAA